MRQAGGNHENGEGEMSINLYKSPAYRAQHEEARNDVINNCFEALKKCGIEIYGHTLKKQNAYSIY